MKSLGCKFPVLLLLIALVGCGGGGEFENRDANQGDGDQEPLDGDGDGEVPWHCSPVAADEEGNPFENLSDYCFFRGPLKAQEPNEGVVRYDVTAPLYSDKSEKLRFIVLPEGEKIDFSLQGHWGWPDETVIVKTFYYPVDQRDPTLGRQILETRLLIKEEGKWKAESYLWNEEQTEARRFNLGRRIPVEFTNDAGERVEIDYRMPNRNQCRTCHGQGGDLKPLGPRTYQLTNPYGGALDELPQLEKFEELGMFTEALPDYSARRPVVNYFDTSYPLKERARSYLDANCAHCHGASGRAASSNLHLGIDIEDPRKIGICKFPVAAGGGAGGLTYDIVPGHPEESIMIYRMETTNLAIKMPELPLTTNDAFGIDLISEWIRQMDPPGCP